MNRILGFAALAVLCSSCFKGAYYEASFTGAAGFNYPFNTNDFPDSVHVHPVIDPSTYIYFNSNVTESGDFRGGFVVSMKRDSSLVIAQDNKYPEFTVYTNPLTSNLGGNVVDGCAIFYDSPDKPAKSAEFTRASSGTCAPVYCMVTNTQPVVKYFAEKGYKPFDDADASQEETVAESLKLIVTGYLNGSKTADVEYVLASPDSVNVSWKVLSLSKLGNIDALDFTLEASNSDIPRYFCLDNLVSKIYIKEE